MADDNPYTSGDRTAMAKAASSSRGQKQQAKDDSRSSSNSSGGSTSTAASDAQRKQQADSPIREGTLSSLGSFRKGGKITKRSKKYRKPQRG